MKTTHQLAAAAIGLLAGSAQALTCGGPSGTRTVTVNPAASCTVTGLGNLGDGAIGSAIGSGATVINRDTTNNNGGSLNITGVDKSSGTWSLAASLWNSYSNLYLYFHFGNGPASNPAYNPDWFIVQLTAGSTTGSWSVNPTKLTLSNIAVVGIPGTQKVPEPSTMALFGLGLGVAGVVLRRRAKASRA